MILRALLAVVLGGLPWQAVACDPTALTGQDVVLRFDIGRGPVPRDVPLIELSVDGSVRVRGKASSERLDSAETTQLVMDLRVLDGLDPGTLPLATPPGKIRVDASGDLLAPVLADAPESWFELHGPGCRKETRLYALQASARMAPGSVALRELADLERWLLDLAEDSRRP